jgi:hypothetical protein
VEKGFGATETLRAKTLRVKSDTASDSALNVLAQENVSKSE